MYLCIIVFLLLAAAVFFLLDLGTLMKVEGSSRRKLREQGKLSRKVEKLIHRARGLVKGSRLPAHIYLLLTIGCGLGGFAAGRFIYGSAFIAVVLGVTMLFTPLLWLSFRETGRKSAELEKLASSMMILSNSYLITEDFLTSVQDNLDILEYPAPFRTFHTYASLMNSDLRTCLREMEKQVGNSYFSQWVDALVMAQEDRKLKYVAVSVVQSLSDALQVQRESDAAMYAVWRDYFLVLILIFATPLVFRLLLAEAYAAMTGTLIGQVLLVLLLAAVVFSVLRALKINRPLVM